MARLEPNARQLEVLRWIADGCPSRDWPDETHKNSALALQNRRLAKVSRRGGWHATITDTGRFYLEHGHYLEVPAPPAKRTDPTRPRRAPPPSEVRPLASVQKSNPVAPPGVGSPELVESPPAPELPPVAVPRHLRRPHPVVESLRDAPGHFDIKGPARNRALRIVQGLVVACEREGWTVLAVRPTGSRWMHSDSREHFVVSTGEAKVSFRVWQDNDRTPHIPTEREIARKKEWPYSTEIRKYDHAPSQRLRIELDRGWGRGRRHSWGDGKRMLLEAKLPEMIVELRERHEDAIKVRLEREAVEAERRRLWQIEVDKAKLKLREHHRAKVLRQEVEDWQLCRRIEQYLDAVEAAVASDEQGEAALEWVNWGRTYIAQLDPLGRDISMPDDPEATDEALAPYLPRRGWGRWGR